MNEVVSVVLIIIAIMQIFLFFKLWGMANNVRIIRNRLPGIKFLEIARDEYRKGYRESPKNILDEEMRKRATYLREKRKIDSRIQYDDLIRKDIENMKSYYDEMNLAYPDFDKYIKHED